MRVASCSDVAARSIDTATIAFGLVSIPVKIYSTNEPSHEVHFHLIHAGCGERLKQQYVCAEHGEVERSDMSNGFELTKGNFVELSKEELKNLEAVASDEVAIREFVPLSAVDPLMIACSPQGRHTSPRTQLVPGRAPAGTQFVTCAVSRAPVIAHRADPLAQGCSVFAASVGIASETGGSVVASLPGVLASDARASTATPPSTGVCRGGGACAGVVAAR